MRTTLARLLRLIASRLDPHPIDGLTASALRSLVDQRIELAFDAATNNYKTL